MGMERSPPRPTTSNTQIYILTKKTTTTTTTTTVKNLSNKYSEVPIQSNLPFPFSIIDGPDRYERLFLL